MGYNFIGWVATNEQWEALPDQTPRTTFIVNEDYDTTGNLYFKAVWDAKKYTVSFKSGEGTVSAVTKIFTFDEVIGELPEVSGNANRFVGWYYGSQKVSVGDKWNIDQSVVELTAVFKKVFQINLHLEQKMKDGKTAKYRLGTGQSATFEVLSDQQIILPVPTSLDTEEYSFSCWKYKDKDGKLVKLESGTVAKMQNFPNVEDTGGMIVLDVYVISRVLWTPFY